MKKRLFAVLAAGIALSAGLATAFAVGSGHVADAEESGVLNNSDSACVYADENSDGVCDNKGNCQGHDNCGKNFIDNDGICDNTCAHQDRVNDNGVNCDKSYNGCSHGKHKHNSHGRHCK